MADKIAMMCKNCKYYYDMWDETQCHRYPAVVTKPDVSLSRDDGCNSTYPDVNEDDWCGEFKAGVHPTVAAYIEMESALAKAAGASDG